MRSALSLSPSYYEALKRLTLELAGVNLGSDHAFLVETRLSTLARNEGYVKTLLGRKRNIPDINSKNRNMREYAERTAYNMPIQGTAADIMKIAMIDLHPKLLAIGAKMLLQVHDELIVEAPEDKLAESSELIESTMRQAYELRVPLVAEVGIGDNWLDAK